MIKDLNTITEITLLLSKQTGLDFNSYKINTVIRRIEKRASFLHFLSFESYLEVLRKDPKEVEYLKNDLLIGVTEFFRDKDVFDFLDQDIIPMLMELNQPLRIWIAGCSTGEEAYSIAILIYNHLEKLKRKTDFKLFATDVSGTSVLYASKGLYPAEALGRMPSEDIEKYFTLKENGYQVNKNLREKIVFAQQNLIADPPFIHMHLISCRNLLIYLKSETQQKVIENFIFSLNKNGFLQLGKSESLGGLKPNFETINSKHKLFKFKNNKKGRLYLNRRIFNHPVANTENLILNHSDLNKKTPVMTDITVQSIFNELLPPLIIVDNHFNIVYTKGDVSDYLKVEEGIFQPNLLKMIDKGPSMILKNAMEQVVKNGTPLILKDLKLQSKEKLYSISLKLQPINSKNNTQYLSVLFLKETEMDENVSEFVVPDISEISKRRIQDLEELLEKTEEENRNLKSELDNLNDKMQASNEELLASNEELQATNEELQSVNEELFSLNTEYQENNTQLIKLNDEVNNLLNSTEIATLFLDKDLNIRNFTPAFERHFRIQRKDIGRTFTNFSSQYSNKTVLKIQEDCKSVLDNAETIEQEITDINSNTYIRRISPFTTSENKIDGVVITMVNVTRLKESQKLIKESESKYRKLIEMMPIAFAYHDVIKDANGKVIDYRFQEVNPMFYELTKLNNVSVTGKNASVIFKGISNKWINTYKTIAENQKPIQITEYSAELEKYFDITGYSTQKGTFVTLFSDVTEKILSEKAIKESEEKYRLLVDNALVGVYQSTTEGKFIYSNDATIKIFGYDSFEELSSINAFDLYKDEKDREKILEILKTDHALSNHECQYKKKDGTEITLLISAKLVDNQLRGMIIDITNRIRYQNELLESQLRFKELIHNSLDGYIRFNINGTILEVNPAFCETIGYSSEELINRNAIDFVPNEWHALDNEILKSQVLPRGYSDLYNKEFLHKDGTHVPVEMRAYLTLDNDGNPLEIWAFVHDITDRLKKEKQLEESKQRLELAVNSANQGLYDMNLITNEVIVNKEYCSMLGYEQELFQETVMSWKNRMHKEDRKHSEKVFSEYIDGRTDEYRVEYRQQTKNGDYKWILSVGKIVEYNGTGNPVRMLGTHTDIDALKKVQDKLSESRERLSLATRASNIGIWDWHLVEDKVYFSSTWKSQVGYDPAELENKFSVWESLLHPDDYSRTIDALRRYIASPRLYFEVEFRLRHKSGHYVWIFNRAASVLDEKGKVVRMFGAHTDISANKRATEEVRKISQRLKIATHSAEIGIWEFDFKTGFLYWDDVMFKIYGISKSQFSNTLNDWERLVHPDDLQNANQQFKLAVEGKKDFKTDFHVIKPDGEISCIHAQAITIKSTNGNPEKMIGVNWDITQDETIKKELINAKEKAEIANVHKNNFLANMSHEIRTPMNGILGFAELLKEENTSPEQKELYLHIINSNSQSLLSLIDDIIDISKIEANEISIYKEPVNINELLIELLTEYNRTKETRNKKHIELKCILDKTLNNKYIRTDKLRLRQIIVNLLNNSLKFTEHGNITFGYTLNRKNIEFFVSDDGIGIPKDKTSEIFGRFYRLDTQDHRKYSGTGLGLAISKGLANLLGGNIWVDESYKNGASFKFTIPFKKATHIYADKNDKIFASGGNSLCGLTVLLVEDQENIYTYFREVLAPSEVEIIWVETGEDAIKTYKELSESINVVLMDINLPGINGIEATKQIKQYDPSAIVIAQTAYAMKEELDKCVKAGCVDFLTKPINPKDLINKLKKYC